MALHPILQGLLVGVARVGVKAGVAALESVLEDVDETVEGARGIVQRATVQQATGPQGRAKKSKSTAAPRRIKVTAKKIDDAEQDPQDPQH